MQLLIALLAILFAVLAWSMMGQSRAPRRRVAPRRRGEGHSTRGHPAERLDDPKLAAAGVAVAIATMDGPLTAGEITTLKTEAIGLFDIDDRTALELVSDGRWIVAEYPSLDEAVEDLARAVRKYAGNAVLDDLLTLVRRVAEAGAPLMPEQDEALAQVRRVFQG